MSSKTTDFKTGGGRRREGTADAEDATTREDLLLPEEAVIFSLSFKSFFCADFEKFFAKKQSFFLFCEKRGTRTAVLVCVRM